MSKSLLSILIGFLFFTQISTSIATSGEEVNRDISENYKKAYDEQVKLNADATGTVQGESSEEEKQLQKKSSDTDRTLSKSDSAASADSTEKNLQSISSQLISNGNFELGHTGWNELLKGYDGNWFSYDGIIEADGGYDSWSAYMIEGEWLKSATFTVPFNSTSLYLEYAGDFWKYGTCSYGTNSITAYLYDETDKDIAEILGVHNASTDTGDYQFYTYYSTTENSLQSRFGHKMTLNFTGIGDDPNCMFSLALDNVSLTATTSDTPTHTPIYRLYNTKNGAFLYAKGDSDRDYVLNKFHDFEFTDGIPAYYASLTAQSGLTPIYRLYNTANGAFLYTKGESDRDYVLNKFSDFEFTDGAPAFYASLTSQDGLTPIYRLYNRVTGMFLYSRGESDRDFVLNKFHDFEFTDGVPAFYATLN